MTRQAIGEGAQVVLWPESSTPFYFEEDRPAAEQVRRIAREARCRCLLGSDQIERRRRRRGTTTPRFSCAPDGIHRRRLPQDAPRAVRRVRAAEAVLFFAAPLVEAVSDFSPGDAAVLLPVRGHSMSTAICYEIVYPDLVRAVRQRRQRTADDDHQRRLVRPHVGAVPALRAGVDARHRERPLSGSLCQHRHQRHRRPVRARAGADRHLQQAVVVGEARFVSERDDLLAYRRRVRLRIGGRSTLSRIDGRSVPRGRVE